MSINRIASYFIIGAFLLGLGSFLIAPSINAQSKPTSIGNTFQIKPQLLTTTGAIAIDLLPGGPPTGKDIYVCWIDMNTNGTATSVTIADKQGTPVNYATSVAIAANTLYSPMGPNASSDQPCRWFPGGLTITAGNANALSVYISGKWWNGKTPF